MSANISDSIRTLQFLMLASALDPRRHQQPLGPAAVTSRNQTPGLGTTSVGGSAFPRKLDAVRRRADHHLTT